MRARRVKKLFVSWLRGELRSWLVFGRCWLKARRVKKLVERRVKKLVGCW